MYGWLYGVLGVTDAALPDQNEAYAGSCGAVVVLPG